MKLVRLLTLQTALVAYIGFSVPMLPAQDATAQAAQQNNKESSTEEAVEAAGIQAIINAGRNNNQVQDHLDKITNQIGPRLTGSNGLQTACEWANEKFKALGLESQLEQWGEFPVGFERGPSYGWMIEPEQMVLNFGTNAWSAGTKGRQVGKAIMGPQTIEELQEMKDEIAGAFVMLPRRSRRRRSENAKEQTAEERRAHYETQKKIREEIMKLDPAGIVRSTSSDLIITGGSHRIEWDDLPTIPWINLQKSQWDKIAELVKAGEDVRLRFDIRNYFRKGPIPLYNVVADIPGSEFPDEYVIVSGHLDSWDGAAGATDNAAGCATTIEAARILMAASVIPRRTIRFMLWSGEEQGLLGSRAWVADHLEEVQKLSAVLVHDGGTNYVAGIVCLEQMRDHFEVIFAAANRLDERTPFEIRDIETMHAPGRQRPRAFHTCRRSRFFWIQRGRATYRTTHHTQYDTYETVVPEYQKHSSIVIALGAYGIANLDQLLPREGIQKQ